MISGMFWRRGPRRLGVGTCPLFDLSVKFRRPFTRDRAKPTKIVVTRVVHEDKPKSDRKTTDGGPDPVHAWVRGPGEDEQADGDEPTRDHHGDQSDFRRWPAARRGR